MNVDLDLYLVLGLRSDCYRIMFIITMNFKHFLKPTDKIIFFLFVTFVSVYETIMCVYFNLFFDETHYLYTLTING